MKINRIAHEGALVLFTLLFAMVGGAAWLINSARQMARSIFRTRIHRAPSYTRAQRGQGELVDLHASRPI